MPLRFPHFLWRCPQSQPGAATLLLAIGLLLLQTPTTFALGLHHPTKEHGVVRTLDRAQRLLTIQCDSGAGRLVLHWTTRTGFIEDGQRVKADALHEGTRVAVYYQPPLFGKTDVNQVRWKKTDVPTVPKPTSGLGNPPPLPRLVTESPGEMQITSARAAWLGGRIMISGSVERKFGYSYPESYQNHIALYIYDASGKPLGETRTDYIPKPLAASFRYGQTRGSYATYLPVNPPPNSVVKIVCAQMD
ncbi:MAG: hypothetical protein JO117_01680 [Verrucomicrobia bacterium]|nr:hypothetical protein [Verrucomicrobiota bacterium]MBV9656562.1 hypothetical protein [Verrucomicrobiota bacterium]